MAPGPRPQSAGLVADLARIVGSGGVSDEEVDRLAASIDPTFAGVLRLREGQVAPLPAAVVWPRSPAALAEVLAFAERRSVPVVMGGSDWGASGCIALDLGRMKRIRAVDGEGLWAEVEAGCNGARLERALAARSLTTGHDPASLACTTVGAWLSTRGGGRCAGRYGKQESIALGVEWAVPGQVLRHEGGCRPGPGLDWTELLGGADGRAGVVSAVVLRLRRPPSARHAAGFRFPSLDLALDGLRRVLRVGIDPAFVRLRDPVETAIEARVDRDVGDLFGLAGRSLALPDALRGPAVDRFVRGVAHRTSKAVLGAPRALRFALDLLPTECAVLLGFEGEHESVRAESELARALLETEGATPLGTDVAMTWFRHRYDEVFAQPRAVAAGLFIERIEAAATWDRVLPLYRAVRRALAPEGVVGAHVGHAYAEGCVLQFRLTGALGSRAGETLARIDRARTRALLAVHEAGGSTLQPAEAGALARERGLGGARLLAALAHRVDPQRILNPGRLGIERPTGIRSVGPGGAALPAAITAAVGERNLLVRAGRQVVRPPDERALSALLRVAQARGVRLMSDQSHLARRTAAGVVEVDLGHFEAVSRISERASLVEVEAGMPVDRLEGLLEAHGMTLGPLHPGCSGLSVGAAVARGLLCRRSVGRGQLGGVLLAARGVLASGELIETRAVPSPSAGPRLDRALFGAEGRFCLLTRVTLRAVRRPPLELEVHHRFPTLGAAVAAARDAMQAGAAPVAARLLGGEAPELSSAFVGPAAPVLAGRTAVIAATAERHGGTRVSGEAGRATGGAFGAVVEVEAPWSRVRLVFEAIGAQTLGEVWVDFMTPEAATVVAEVHEAVARATLVAAAKRAGGRVLDGAGDPAVAALAADWGRALDPNHVLG